MQMGEAHLRLGEAHFELNKFPKALEALASAEVAHPAPSLPASTRTRLRGL